MRYPNADKGIKKIFIAEILEILGAVMGIAIIAMLAANKIDLKTSSDAIAQALQASNLAALAVVLAFAMTGFWSNMYKTTHDKAVELMPDSMWAQASEDTNHGIMGIISKLPTDEASLNKLVDELNQLNKMTDENK